MINYLNIISTYYPGTQCSTSSSIDDYDSIQWVSDPIPKEDLDLIYLVQIKTEKIIELSVDAEGEIINGFVSSALGSPYWYDSQPEDQLNLIGSVSSGDDMYYACRETLDSMKQYLLHTHEQLKQVVRDGRDVKLSVLQKFNDKRNAVLGCTTQQQVDAITWDSIE